MRVPSRGRATIVSLSGQVLAGLCYGKEWRERGLKLFGHAACSFLLLVKTIPRPSFITTSLDVRKTAAADPSENQLRCVDGQRCSSNIRRMAIKPSLSFSS